MSYGLRIKNSAGEIQIDDRWKTLRVREKGTIEAVGPRRDFVTLTSGCTPADAPLFATHSTGRHYVAHTPITDELTLAAININSELVELSIERGTGTGNTVKWLVVDASTPAPTTDTHGLIVRNAAGESVFDSRQDLVLIRDVILVEATTPITRTFSHAACRGTPYYVSGMRQAYVDAFGIEPVLFTQNISSTSVSVFINGGNNTSWDPNPIPLLVLDVFD